MNHSIHRTVYRAIYNALIQSNGARTMAHITANDLKTRGIAAIEAMLGGGRTEAVVSVRGADRYVVMELAHYQHLRECELEAALAETRSDIAAGRFVVESPQAHLARLQALVADGDAVASAGPAVAAAAIPTPAPAPTPTPAPLAKPQVRSGSTGKAGRLGKGSAG